MAPWCWFAKKKMVISPVRKLFCFYVSQRLNPNPAASSSPPVPHRLCRCSARHPSRDRRRMRERSCWRRSWTLPGGRPSGCVQHIKSLKNSPVDWLGKTEFAGDVLSILSVWLMTGNLVILSWIIALRCLPSGKLTQLWKITTFNGKIHYKWQFSIAILR